MNLQFCVPETKTVSIYSKTLAEGWAHRRDE